MRKHSPIAQDFCNILNRVLLLRVETDLNTLNSQLFLHELTDSRSFAIELVPMTQLTFADWRQS